MRDEENEKKLIRKGLNNIPKKEIVEFLLIFYMQPPHTITSLIDWVKMFQSGLGTLVKKHLNK